VDLILKDVLARSCDYSRQFTTYNGRKCTTSSLTMTANIPFGAGMGATPDGRKAGEPLAEGGISPHQGRNISGATATLNSVAKLDQVKLTNGSILNMRISPGTVKDKDGLRKFSNMIRTFFENGGNLVQFNFTDNKTLRDAQKHPENYKDLLVRVATYSAYFVEISPELQENIIERVELE
jgi:pyruvate-formate lyase